MSGAVLSPAMGAMVLAGLVGVSSYLFYYKGIDTIGATRGMALNISYSAWACVFGVVLLGNVPSMGAIVCCAVILCGTVLAASDWDELFGPGKAKTEVAAEA